MVLGSCFHLELIKPRKKAMLASLENLWDHRPELNLMMREGTNPERRLSSNKSDDGRKVQIFKRNIMMKLKAYIGTMMKPRYQRKNSVQNSGGHHSGQEQ